MLVARIIPCLLVIDGALVKTVRFKRPNYVGDPMNAIRIFNEKEVDELVFLDIVATHRRREPSYELIKEIASECFMPVTYGGGVTALSQLERIFSLGIEKVAINTAGVTNPQLIREASRTFGSQSIVGSIDVRKDILRRYRVYTHAGRQATNLDPARHALHLEELGVGEILLTSMDRDGTMEGYDVDLVRRVTDVTTVPLIACGGAGAVRHIETVILEAGASAAAIGSMAVYHGRNRAVLIGFPSRAELARVISADISA